MSCESQRGSRQHSRGACSYTRLIGKQSVSSALPYGTCEFVYKVDVIRSLGCARPGVIDGGGAVKKRTLQQLLKDDGHNGAQRRCGPS